MCFLSTTFPNDLTVTHFTCSNFAMETTSLQIELAYLFSKFSSLGNVYLFFIMTSSLMFP